MEVLPMARKLTSRVLQARYGVVDRTIDRWVEAGILPVPMRINKIRYWDETRKDLGGLPR
jgi:predicted site-specific integrase-resolvase